MSAQRLIQLDKPTRRRAVLRTSVSIVLTWIVTFSIYFALPLNRDVEGIVVELTLGILAFIGIATWQTLRILRSKVPMLQATEALGVLGAFFIVLFAATYLAIATARPESFTQSLDHMASLYFTITVLATVGFGDISAVTPVARSIVSAQMILDLVLLAGVARVILGAAQRSLAAGPTPDA